MTFGDRARAWTRIGLGATGAGLLVVLLAVWVYYLTHSGSSLEDAYWAAPSPWVPGGVAVTIAGATVSVLAGTAATLVGGEWVRRLLALAATGTAAVWWAVVPGWLALPTVRGIDPVRLAFELPSTAAIFLIAPALAAGAAALLPPGPPRPERPRLRRVHPPGGPRDERGGPADS